MSEQSPTMDPSGFVKALVETDLDYQDFPKCATFVLAKTGQPGDIHARLLASAGMKAGDPHPYARPYKVIADLLDVADNFELLIQAEGATARSPERIILGWRETQISEDIRLELQIPRGHELTRDTSAAAGGDDLETTSVDAGGAW